MKRYILTGAPGAGKTALLRQLGHDGFPVVEEAATDVIALEQAKGVAEPWTDPAFPDRVASLQARRLGLASDLAGEVQFHDRSVFCTCALASFLGHPISSELARQAADAAAAHLFEPRVFFIELLGFITPTEARRIDYAGAQEFARVHLRIYQQFGFEPVRIDRGALRARADAIVEAVRVGRG